MMMVSDHKHSHKRSLMFEYTLNITTTWLFGELHNSMTKEEADTVQDNSDCASFGCGIRVRLAEAAILLQPWRISRVCKPVKGSVTFLVSKDVAIRRITAKGQDWRSILSRFELPSQSTGNPISRSHHFRIPPTVSLPQDTTVGHILQICICLLHSYIFRQ
jgi:hypothetical protein